MFRISRRLDYGLQLMIALAQDEHYRPQATAVLAERLHIPLPFLHQIGRSLIQGGLIKATPGPRGGLRLHQSSGNITLLQIIETLEGPVSIPPEPNESGNGASSRAIWEGLQRTLVIHLSAVSLQSMADQREIDSGVIVHAYQAVDHTN